MTEIGKQFINEFKRELEEKRIDDNTRIWLSQSLTFTGACLKLIFLWMPLILFYSFVCALAIITIGLTDIDTVETIRLSTNQDIADGAGSIIYFTVFVSTFFGMLYFIFKAVWGVYPFSNKHHERDERDWMEIKLLKRIVEIQEELLIRHDLIKGEYNEKTD